MVEDAVAFKAWPKVVRKMVSSWKRFTLMISGQMIVEPDDTVVECKFTPCMGT